MAPMPISMLGEFLRDSASRAQGFGLMENYMITRLVGVMWMSGSQRMILFDILPVVSLRGCRVVEF
jgi:hypothetical protein